MCVSLLTSDSSAVDDAHFNGACCPRPLIDLRSLRSYRLLLTWLCFSFLSPFFLISFLLKLRDHWRYEKYVIAAFDIYGYRTSRHITALDPSLSILPPSFVIRLELRNARQVDGNILFWRYSVRIPADHRRSSKKFPWFSSFLPLQDCF